MCLQLWKSQAGKNTKIIKHNTLLHLPPTVSLGVTVKPKRICHRHNIIVTSPRLHPVPGLSASHTQPVHRADPPVFQPAITTTFTKLTQGAVGHLLPLLAQLAAHQLSIRDDLNA